MPKTSFYSGTGITSEKADAVESSANAAAQSAADAATSETNALTSETNAATSEANAASSAANALTSETNASSSAANALTSETNAAASETNAAASETNAAASEANALASATSAQNLEITSASFDTTDGTLTLTKANSGTVTTDLDGRYAELTGDTFTGDVSFGDNLKAKFGADDDLLIYHSTTSGQKSVIEDTGTGGLDLITNGNAIRFMTDDGDYMLSATRNSGVTLLHDNYIKLQTTVDGIRVVDDAQFDTNINVDGNITVSGTVDGVDIATLGANAIVDGDFTSNGFMKRDGAGAYSVDTNTYITASDITGKANLSGADFTGTVGIGSLGSPQTLGVYGATSLYNELNVTGDITATNDVSISGTVNTNNIESTIDSVDYPVYSTSLDGSNAIATLGGTASGDKVHTLEMRPAAGGVRMHWHQGGLYDGIAGTSDTTDTLRFHTTDRGIHVGDDSVGTYTAGDNQNNADVDFGMLVGRSSTNIGTNNFGFGHGLSFNSSDIASCLGAGTLITFQNKTQSSIGMGADVTVGEYNTPIADPPRKAIFAGGNVVTGSGEYSFTWAKGDYGGGGSNGLVRYSASNLGTGCVLFGYQTEILSTCNYSFNGGSRGLSGDYKHQRLNDCDYTISWGFQNETDRSNSTAVFGQGNDVADSSTTIVAGLNNTVKDSKYAFVTGFGNASYCYGGVIGGQSNIVGKDVVDNTDGKYSACFGFDNLVESDGNFVSGYENNTLGHSSACIGRGLKTPLFQPNGGGDYVWDDYSITVGAFNDEAHKYTTNTLGSSWVKDHRFVVGTGTASNAKDNGFIVAVPDSGFSGIIMPNLASSPSYTDDVAAVTGGVPVGGLYHTNGVVKVRRS